MHASAISHLRQLFLLILLAWGAALHAQNDARLASKMDRGSAELVVEGPVEPGTDAMVAIAFEPVEGWHGYWSNPGDAGRGLTLDWQLPDGWAAGEPQFPVPHKLLISGLMNHVFEGEHAVLVPLSVPPDAAPGIYTIEARGEWLTCSDTLCVPQWGTLRAEVEISSPAETRDARFAAWRGAIPPLLDREAIFERRNETLRLAIPLPASMAVGEPHAFIETERLVDYAAPQTFRRKGDWLIAEIPLKGGSEADRVEGILSLDGENGIRFVARVGEVPEGGEIVAGTAPELPPLWLLVLGALGGGLLLNIMPCVFPILSIKALALARAGESEAQARREGLAYTAGVVLACVALGGLLLATAITANFAGVFELPSLSFTRGGEPASAFATGLLAAFVATPCTGPFMAVALGAALLLPPAYALLLFALLGLGLALPFLLIGLIPPLRAMLPRPGAWMERFRKMMAIPMGLTALALVWLTARLGGKNFALMAMIVLAGLMIALFVVGRLQRSGKMAWPAFGLIAAPFLLFGAFALPASIEKTSAGAASSILEPRSFSKAALAEARASGRPVFLWFTADWCVTCKVNESVAIERETTRDVFEQAGVIPMVGDWTRPDPEITAFLNAQGAAGVPLYLWYEPGEDAEQLPQVLTPDMLTQRAARR